MADRSPTLANVLKRALDSRLYGMRVSIPARVERYDAAKRSVDVKPLVRDTVNVGTEDEQSVSVPVISNVPVVFPGAGGFGVTFPIARGDTVLLVFADRSLDKWLSSGGEVDPVDVRSHHLSDAIAIPGLHSFSTVVEAHSEDLVVGIDGGAQIHLKPNGEVHIGGENAADWVALAAKVNVELDRIKADLTTLKGAISSAPVAPMDGGATFKAALIAALPAFPSAPGSVAAEKTKAD